MFLNSFLSFEMFLSAVSKVYNGKTQLFQSVVSHTIQQKAHYGKNGHFDVIIVGGGAAGISLAGTIGKSTILQDKKVLLLDAAPTFKGYDPDIYSNRVYALNKNTVNLLKKIGAWNTIKSIRCRPVKQMQVWDSSSDALITFSHDNFTGNLAFIIENDVLLFAILKEIEKNSNIVIQTGAKIDKIQLESETGKNNEIHLTTGEQFSAELLVGADGANSMVRDRMNVNNFSMRYNQMGLVATVHLKECENNFVAWQRFIPNGVIALLPLTDELSSIVWSTDTKHFQQLMKLNENEFVDAVNEAFMREYVKSSTIDTFNRFTGNLLKSVSQEVRQLPPQIKRLYQNSRAGFPLGFAHASKYAGRGAALIGDAAHRIHPLAGLGLNLGMGDVKCLTEKLEAAAFNGTRLNNLDYLLQYEQHQLRHNVPIMLGVHGIHQIYNTDSSIVALTRSIGIQFTQKMAPLKNFFMEKAMG